MDTAYQSMLKYLLEIPRFLLLSSDNILIALGAMKAFMDIEIRVPEDVSIIEYDDLNYSSILSTPFLTLPVPKKEMGRMAVKRILDIINGSKESCNKIQVCTEFIEHNSVQEI